MNALFLLVNLCAILLLSAPELGIGPARAYVRPESMFLTLAVIDGAFFLLLIPILSSPWPAGGASGPVPEDAPPENPLAAVFRRGAWAAALYQAVVLTALSCPFLLLASRVAPLPPGALATSLGCLLVIAADLSLLNLLAGRWYYPVALGLAALPPLVDYLVLDLLKAPTAILTTLSPIGLLVAATGGEALAIGGLSAPRGVLLYALLFLAMAVLAPVPKAGEARG